MRSSIIVLIISLVVGSIIITSGFIFNQKESIVIEESNSYEKLLNYKNELENINKYNIEILSELEKKLQNSNVDDLETINEEISVLKRVIDDNKKELENIIQKLSDMKDTEN